MKILVTGGCGFIGSNFIRLLLSNGRKEIEIVNYDCLTYAGNMENLNDLRDDRRYRFVKGRIEEAELVNATLAHGGFDAIVNFAAETHVDRSLYYADTFVKTNIMGTQTLLDGAKKHGVRKFLQISTDEVYGSLPKDGLFTEESPLTPSSPYSASKTGADLLCLAYGKTFGLPVTITRSSNNYGSYQFPEKFVPLFIGNAMENLPLPLYGDGLHVRDWIYVEDNCRAIECALEKGREGEVYNIGGGNEYPNIEMAKKILKLLGRPESLITFVKDRPGHDRRYALDSTKAKRELGWTPKVSLMSGLEKTVGWYVKNREWLQRVKSGEYRKFYDKHYANG